MRLGLEKIARPRYIHLAGLYDELFTAPGGAGVPVQLTETSGCQMRRRTKRPVVRTRRRGVRCVLSQG